MSKQLNVFANSILISILLFFVASLIYAVRRSEFYAPGTMTKFYLIFIAGILLCLFTLKLRQDYKINFVLLIVSLFIGVYLIELYLFCCSTPHLTNLYAQAAKAAGVPFDERTRYQAFLDLVEKEGEAYPSVNVARFLELHGLEIDGDKISPLSGVSKKTTLVCNESGEYVIYLSDEHGFNNPAGLYTPGAVDIALIGDSFTHGFCVSAGEDVASRLRRTGKTVINLGYGGNGPLIELAALKEYAERLRPKIVLWMYYEGNDLEDLAVEQQSPIFLNYLDRDFSQNLYERQSDVDRVLVTYLNEQIAEFEKQGAEDAQFALNTRLARIVRLYHLREMSKRIFSAPPPSPPPSPLFEEILKEAKARTSSWGGTLYFVYLPAWQRYGTEVDHENLFHRDRILSTVAGLEIPIIDMHENFNQHPDPLSLFPFRLPGHYVAEGYELVASTIETHLEAERDLVGVSQP